MLFLPSSQEMFWGPVMYAVSKHVPVFKIESIWLHFQLSTCWEVIQQWLKAGALQADWLACKSQHHSFARALT